MQEQKRGVLHISAPNGNPLIDPTYTYKLRLVDRYRGSACCSMAQNGSGGTGE